MKISTILYFVLLAVLLTAAAFFARFGLRCYLLKKAIPTATFRYRAEMVPKELDLTAVQVNAGPLCDLGYAEFVLPERSLLQLASILQGTVVKATTGSVNFAFMTPWADNGLDLSATSGRPLSSAREKAEVRQTLGPIPNQLDQLLQIEQTMPLPWFAVMAMGSRQFTLHSVKLILKAMNILGYGGVYTFTTSEIRGYIQVGKTPKDRHIAQVDIQDRAGKLSVRCHLRYLTESNDDILVFLKPVLKSFRFKVHTITSDDQIRKLIADAGIQPDAAEDPQGK